jgi:signal transduction histidine kinase
MRISHRLYLAVAPAILGVLTVAGLAYWGAYHRAAPEWVVVVAAVSAVGSLILAWQNTRYVAQRVERLAGARAQHESASLSPLGVVRNAALPRTRGTPDELDSIEEVVDHLSSAVSVAQAEREARERAAAERVQEYAVLIDEGSAAVRRQLDEARVALHILLEHHFGPLNDNQDEMLEAARTGTDAAETELARLQEIAQLDRGALNVRREPLRVADLLQSLRPQLEADGAKAGVTLTVDTMPGLPRIVGDRIRLQQAFELLLRHLVRHATAGTALTIATQVEAGELRIAVLHTRPPTLDADVALARRIIQAHGGHIDVSDEGTTIALPATSGSRRGPER